MNKLVVLIKFNRNDLYVNKKGYKNGMRFRKTLARKEWWQNRYKILKDIVLPSLGQQTLRNFEIVVPFTTDIPKGYADEIINLFKSLSHHVCWDDRKLKDFVEPDEFLRQKYHNKVDNLILVNLDSDDVYHKDAFKKLMEVPVKEGQVYIFRNGYVYDIPTKRLAHYVGFPSPAPFFAFTFTNKSLESKKSWDEYRTKFGLWVEHPFLDRCKVKVEMPDNLYSYVFHDFNVTSSWENSHHKDKIKSLIKGKEKNRILNEVGIKIK